MNAIFVYGLLKPGQSLHHVVEPYVVAGEAATVRGRLYDAGVPAARFDEDGRIEGVVFRLDEARLDEALAVLDELEDEGTEYRRVVVRAECSRGPEQVWSYEYLPDVGGRPDVGPAWPEPT